MALSTADVIKLSQQKPLSTQEVQSLATPPPVSPALSITPKGLTPEAPIVPVVPAPSNLPPTPTLPTPVETPVDPYEPTAGESEISKMIREMNTGTTALGTKEAFIEQQNLKYGVARQNALLKSLNTQFTNLVNEAKIIPEQIQQDIQGGGANVTKGGVAPMQTAQLRANTLKQYQIAAQYAVASDDLATALAYVDQAVKLEFQPEKDRLDAQKANIEMLLKDPTLTLAQQKRADALKKQNDAETKALADKEANAKSIEALVLQAQQNGAPAALIGQARTAKDIFEVGQILQGWTAKETAQSIQEYNFAVKNGYKGSYTQYQNEDANRKVAIAKAGVAKNDAGLTPYQVFTATQALSKDNQKRTENAREISRQVSIMDTAYNSYINGGDKNVATQAIIATFNKILDPTSVVRESEYDRTAAGQALLARVQGKYENIAQGGAGVTAETLKSAVDLGNQYLKNAQQSILDENKRSALMAQQFGLDAGLVSSVSTPQEMQTPQKQVEQAVQSSGKTYQQIIDGAPVGQIAVVQDGFAGYIPVEEFDPSIHVRM